MNSTLCDSLGQKYHLQGVNTIASKTRFIEYSLPLAITVIILNCLLAISAIVTNSLVIATFFAYKQLRVPNNLLLTCLASSDFLVGSVVLPSFVFSLVESVKGKQKCTVDARIVIEILSGVNLSVSLGFLLLITIDRYLAIERALRYHVIVTCRRTMYAVVSTWTFAAALAVCNRLLSLHSDFIRALWWGYTISVCIAITAIYLKLYNTSRKHIRRISTQERHLDNSKTNIKNVKSAKTFAFVFVSLCICYLPYCVLRIIETRYIFLIDKNVFLRDVMTRIALTLMFSSSTISPFLYFLRSRRLRFYCRGLFSKVRIALTEVS